MKKEKILIIKLGAIGDVLMATPSFESIRNKHKDAEVFILIGNWSKDILINNPCIDTILAVDENIFWKKNIFKIFILFLKLRKIGFSIIYVMHWSNIFNLFAYLLGAKEIIGFDRFGKSMFLTKRIPFSEGESNRHIIFQYLSLSNETQPAKLPSIKIYLTENELKAADSNLRNYGITSSDVLIGIAPGGGNNPKMSMPIRRWSLIYFSELINLIISSHDCRIILFGDKKETDIANNILFKVSNINIISFVGATTIRETAAILSKCRLIITNDSALMHLSSAVGTKTVSIFGPTSPYDKAPVGEGHVFIYKDLLCSPCYKYGKFPNCKTIDCMAQILPVEVYQEFLKMFELNRTNN